jgi:hypothetical protein
MATKEISKSFASTSLPATQKNYYKIGEAVAGTNYRLAAATVVRKGGPRVEVSEVQLVHSRTGRKVGLPFNKAVEVVNPDEPDPATRGKK